MISRVSSFLGPKSIFNIGGGGTPSLVLSLDAAGYTGSGLWGDLSTFNNDGISDGLVSWSSEGGGSFDFDGSSAYFLFGKSNYNFDPSPLVSYGVTFSSNSVTSTEPAGNWDTKQTVSSESYSGGVRLKFQTGGPNPGFLMCGLSESPYDPIVNYSKPNYGFYVQGPNLLTIVEGGNFNVNPMAGTYSDTTNYIIIWDGTEVKYYVDEVLVYTSTSTPTNPLYLYCTFLNSELIINNIEFGPYAQGIPIGNSPYVQGLPVGNSPYTMEAWFKSDSFGPSEQGTLIGWGASGQMYKSNVLRLNANGLTNYWWGDDISVSFSGTSSMYVDNWYYVAATYDGTTRKLYLNGNLVQSGTPSAPLEVDDIQSLKVGYSYTNYFDGKISKVKVHTKALPSSKILSNFNTDKVRHGYVFGSMTFTQSESSYLISSSSDYAFGTNDFTVEAFFKSSDYSLNGGVVSLRDVSTYINGVGITLIHTATPSVTTFIEFSSGNNFLTYTASVDVWYHVAISRVGSTSSFFVNGNLFNEVEDTLDYGNNDLVVGRYYTDINDYYFSGIISNVRVINGTGLYTSNFTIPDVQLGATSSTKLLITSQQTNPTADVSDLLQSVTASNIGWTSSLPEFIVSQGLEFFVDATDSISNPSNSSSNWIDISGNGRNLTFSGPTFYPVCRPGCANSLLFSSNQTAQTSQVTISYPTGYTIESVVCFSNLSNGDGIFEFDESSSGKFINVQRESNGTIRFEVNQGNQLFSDSTTTNNLWYHITCVYNSSTQLAKIYINGVEDASGTYVSTTSTTAPIILGLHDTYLDGSISLTRFYNIPFTPSQVLINFNYTKSVYGL